jgi:hypothetical protein|eukprot:COSAG01_NODE_2030_length_8590_cov_20.238017_11_plen_81_part_00
MYTGPRVMPACILSHSLTHSLTPPAPAPTPTHSMAAAAGAGGLCAPPLGVAPMPMMDGGATSAGVGVVWEGTRRLALARW